MDKRQAIEEIINGKIINGKTLCRSCEWQEKLDAAESARRADKKWCQEQFNEMDEREWEWENFLQTRVGRQTWKDVDPPCCDCEYMCTGWKLSTGAFKKIEQLITGEKQNDRKDTLQENI